MCRKFKMTHYRFRRLLDAGPEHDEPSGAPMPDEKADTPPSVATGREVTLAPFTLENDSGFFEGTAGATKSIMKDARRGSPRQRAPKRVTTDGDPLAPASVYTDAQATGGLLPGQVRAASLRKARALGSPRHVFCSYAR
jgi:hypothetical protein